jgi:hypothetical protein
MVMGWRRAVVLVAPANEEERAEKTPLLDWEDAGGATGYELQIVESEDLFEGAEVFPVTESRYEIPEPLTICDERFWRVRAVKDGEAEPGPWSETWSFKIVVSDSPLLVGEVVTGGNPYRLALEGNYAYVPLESTTGLKIIDTSDPSDPVIVGNINKKFMDLTVKDQYIYAILMEPSNQLEVYDVTDPSAPAFQGSCPFTFDSNNYYAQDCVIWQNHVYAVVQTEDSVSDAGIMKIDISDPSSPEVAGMTSFDPIKGGSWNIDIFMYYIIAPVEGGIFCYYAASHEMLDYLEISSLEYSYVAVEKEYIFVTSMNGPVYFIDFSTPSDMKVIGEYDPGTATAIVIVFRDYLFFGTFPEYQMYTVDISDISSPTLVTKHDLPVMEVVGNYAYSVDYIEGKFQIVDLVPED